MWSLKVHLVFLLFALLGVYAAYNNLVVPNRAYFTDREAKDLAFIFDIVLRKYSLIELKNYDRIMTAEKYKTLIQTLLQQNEFKIFEDILAELMNKAKFGFCTENAILLMLEAMEQNNSEPLARKIIKNFYEKCQPAWFTRSFCGSIIIVHTYLHFYNLTQVVNNFNYAAYSLDLCNYGLSSL